MEVGVSTLASRHSAFKLVASGHCSKYIDCIATPHGDCRASEMCGLRTRLLMDVDPQNISDPRTDSGSFAQKAVD